MKTVPSKNKRDVGKKTCNKTLQVELNMLKEEIGDTQKLRTERGEGKEERRGGKK